MLAKVRLTEITAAMDAGDSNGRRRWLRFYSARRRHEHDDGHCHGHYSKGNYQLLSRGTSQTRSKKISMITIYHTRNTLYNFFTFHISIYVETFVYVQNNALYIVRHIFKMFI